MASAEARQAAIKSATEQVRAGGPFTRRARRVGPLSRTIPRMLCGQQLMCSVRIIEFSLQTVSLVRQAFNQDLTEREKELWDKSVLVIQRGCSVLRRVGDRLDDASRRPLIRTELDEST